MYSRVRASGLANGIPYQPSTTCGPDTPRPRMKRPPERMVHRHRRHRRRGRLARRHLHDRRAQLQALGRWHPTTPAASGSPSRMPRPSRSSRSRAARPRRSTPSRPAAARRPSSRCSVPASAPAPCGRDYSWWIPSEEGSMAVTVGVLSDTRRRALEAVCDTFAPSLRRRRRRVGAQRDFYARSRVRPRASPGQIEALLAQTAAAGGDRGARPAARRLRRAGLRRLPLGRAHRARARDRRLEPGGEVRRAPAARADVPVLLRPARRGRPQPQLGRDRLPRAALARRRRPSRRRRRSRSRPISGESATLDGRRLRRRLRRRRRRDRRRAAARPDARWSCSRWASTATSPTSTSSSCPGMFELYLGGGLAASEDGSIAILAGSTLGGGTVVNYMNCIRTPEHIRREWAAMGDRGHRRARLRRAHRRRLEAARRQRHRDLAEPHAQTPDRRVREARLPATAPLTRNTDASCEDPSVCGYCFAGCQKGCKQSTMKTFLQDAADAGARFVVGARAERILTDDGRASGVQATVTHADGSTHRADRARADRRRRRAARSSRRRCCCARASAARPPASTCACTPRRSSAASTSSRSRAGSGRSSRRCRTSSSSARASTAS